MATTDGRAGDGDDGGEWGTAARVDAAVSAAVGVWLALPPRAAGRERSGSSSAWQQQQQQLLLLLRVHGMAALRHRVPVGTGAKLEEAHERRSAPACFCCALPTLLVDRDAPKTTRRPGVITGYRGTGWSFKECTLSALQLNNETVNIHSHLLPAIYFAWQAAVWGYDLYHHRSADPTLPYRCCSLLFLFGGIIVHLNSAVYHCYAAHSEVTAARLLRYDLAGIGFFILVCMINGVVHAFRCTPAWRAFYLVTQTALGLLTLATPLFPRQLPMLQPHSVVVKLYSAVVCSGLIPAAHWLISVATPTEWTLIFPRVVGFFAWLGVGLGFYLTRFPESRWPGRFDVVSHPGLLR